jgi:dTDP-4-dehydrorhamnose reductase
MRIAIIGESGQLARCLMETIPEGVGAVAFGRQRLDLSDPSAPLSDVFEDAFDIAINAAAFTAVDRAENERDLAFAVNADGPERLARYCAACSLPLIHVSTDYVFSGGASRPYRETDDPDPCNTYGASKLAGERAIAELMPQHVIIRTSWLYSAYGQNFPKTMLRLAKSHDHLRIVNDQ